MRGCGFDETQLLVRKTCLLLLLKGTADIGMQPMWQTQSCNPYMDSRLATQIGLLQFARTPDI